MNTAAIIAPLAIAYRELGELNDAAINTVREFCAVNGYNTAALMVEEIERIEADNLDLEGYRRARRIGSHFRLARSARCAIWAVYETRRAIGPVRDALDRARSAV